MVHSERSYLICSSDYLFAGPMPSSGSKRTKTSGDAEIEDNLGGAYQVLDQLSQSTSDMEKTLEGPFVEFCRLAASYIEGLPITPLLQGGLSSTPVLRYKRLLLLSRGQGKKPFGRFAYSYQYTFAKVNALKTMLQNATGAVTVRNVLSHLSTSRRPAFRDLVAHLNNAEDATPSHVMQDLAPAKAYPYMGANPKVNSILLTTDELDAITTQIETSASPHVKRFWLQSWDAGRPLEKNDTASSTICPKCVLFPRRFPVSPLLCLPRVPRCSTTPASQ